MMVQTGEVTTLPTDAFFVAIGHKPNTDIFKSQIDLDESGYVMVYDETKTSVEGVFVQATSKTAGTGRRLLQRARVAKPR